MGPLIRTHEVDPPFRSAGFPARGIPFLLHIIMNDALYASFQDKIVGPASTSTILSSRCPAAAAFAPVKVIVRAVIGEVFALGLLALAM